MNAGNHSIVFQRNGLLSSIVAAMVSVTAFSTGCGSAEVDEAGEVIGSAGPVSSLQEALEYPLHFGCTTRALPDATQGLLGASTVLVRRPLAPLGRTGYVASVEAISDSSGNFPYYPQSDGLPVNQVNDCPGFVAEFRNPERMGGSGLSGWVQVEAASDTSTCSSREVSGQVFGLGRAGHWHSLGHRSKTGEVKNGICDLTLDLGSLIDYPERLTDLRVMAHASQHIQYCTPFKCVNERRPFGLTVTAGASFLQPGAPCQAPALTWSSDLGTASAAANASDRMVFELESLPGCPLCRALRDRIDGDCALRSLIQKSFVPVFHESRTELPCPLPVNGSQTIYTPTVALIDHGAIGDAVCANFKLPWELGTNAEISQWVEATARNR